MDWIDEIRCNGHCTADSLSRIVTSQSLVLLSDRGWELIPAALGLLSQDTTSAKATIDFLTAVYKVGRPRELLLGISMAMTDRLSVAGFYCLLKGTKHVLLHGTTKEKALCSDIVVKSLAMVTKFASQLDKGHLEEEICLVFSPDPGNLEFDVAPYDSEDYSVLIDLNLWNSTQLIVECLRMLYREKEEGVLLTKSLLHLAGSLCCYADFTGDVIEQKWNVTEQIVQVLPASTNLLQLIQETSCLATGIEECGIACICYLVLCKQVCEMSLPRVTSAEYLVQVMMKPMVALLANYTTSLNHATKAMTLCEQCFSRLDQCKLTRENHDLSRMKQLIDGILSISRFSMDEDLRTRSASLALCVIGTLQIESRFFILSELAKEASDPSKCGFAIDQLRRVTRICHESSKSISEWQLSRALAVVCSMETYTNDMQCLQEISRLHACLSYIQYAVMIDDFTITKDLKTIREAFLSSLSVAIDRDLDLCQSIANPTDENEPDKLIPGAGDIQYGGQAVVALQLVKSVLIRVDEIVHNKISASVSMDRPSRQLQGCSNGNGH